jgi:peptidoglycan/LPS O-acetylase OafA/YrhL
MSNAFAPPSQKPLSIPSLDGLRAFSILIVFLSHAGLSRVIPGTFGVTVFFFLSGYLITTLLRLEAEEHGRISLKQFYLRRAVRILPPLYLALGATVVLMLAGILPGQVVWGAVAAQGLHLANYYDVFGPGGEPPGTGVLWSLAVEEHFYLVFPFLYLALRRWLPEPRKQVLVLAALCVLVLGWRCLLVLVVGLGPSPLPGSDYFPRTLHATDTRLDSLLFGCILGICGNPALPGGRPLRGRLLALGLCASGVVFLFTFWCPAHWCRETLRYTLQGLALFPVFVAAIRWHDWGIFRVLNLRWVRFLGVLSYTLYLIHHTVIIGVQHWVHCGAFLKGCLAFALSVALSTAVYLVVEKPCARLRKRWSQGNKPAQFGRAGKPVRPTRLAG